MTSSPRPHLLEVNTIPSLFINKTTEELDLRLKGPIVAESLNICGHHISSGRYLITQRRPKIKTCRDSN